MTPAELRELRKKCRMTVIELSRRTGISQEKIAEFEDDRPAGLAAF